ncbi:MAG: helix-turn-helix domain-containing protein [Clostridia bacterium]|nr:helix-turn-helix domain-containing protein [Clostridia bacterium]
MENNLNVIISQNLKREIETCGKSKTEIADGIGVTKSTITQYCTGRAQPTLTTLSRLCTFLDCSADDILNIKR